MNRLALMLMRNIFRLPGLYAKLCHYAKHTDEYPEQEKYDHIRYIMELAVKSGNIDLIITGQDKLPQENGFGRSPLCITHNLLGPTLRNYI